TTSGHASACAAGSAIDLANCGDDTTAYVIAHETGHFLGLYHTTEGDGESFDPLVDTDKCPCDTCKLSTADACADAISSPTVDVHQMTAAECSRSSTCGGGTNLMFWVLSGTSLGLLTDEQRSVMSANPLVH
ncbi:MAG TPA: M12 family metallo-peptidase, partial [Anaeromyxobacteraceae bacterium]|nr:M12 family metallo-peptidase [Anaeromyxobacteraceae bacterium]